MNFVFETPMIKRSASDEESLSSPPSPPMKKMRCTQMVTAADEAIFVPLLNDFDMEKDEHNHQLPRLSPRGSSLTRMHPSNLKGLSLPRRRPSFKKTSAAAAAAKEALRQTFASCA